MSRVRQIVWGAAVVGGGWACIAVSYGQEDADYRHPLLSRGAQAAIAARGLDAVLAEDAIEDRFEVGLDGQARWTSGVVTVERQQGTSLYPPQRASRVPDDPRVEAALRGEDGREATWVASLDVPFHGVFDDLYLRAVGRGDIHTPADVVALRHSIVKRRIESGLSPVGRLVSQVSASGGKVMGWSAAARTVTFSMLGSRLHRVASLPGVRLSSWHDPELDAPPEPVDGLGTNAEPPMQTTGAKLNGMEVAAEIQADQFYWRGIRGVGVVGVYEGGADNLFVQHPGFLDAAGVRRAVNCAPLNNDLEPDKDGCIAVDNTWADPHSTAVASALAGDITVGQDPDIAWIPDNSPRRARSGVAREARVLGVGEHNLWDWSSSVLVLNADSGVVSHSASSSTEDPTCEGHRLGEQRFNQLYEAGVAAFQSAGNNGHSALNNCTVGSPAPAIGVFAVGAYERTGDPIPRDVLYGGTARGGTSSEGEGRTIIGLAGPSRLEFPYPHHHAVVGGQEYPEYLASGLYGADWEHDFARIPGEFCCTSASTPVVAGAAVLWRDWYLGSVGNAADQPGVLYTNLLLMGDRTGVDSSGQFVRTTAGFDNLTGAGLLRLRAFDPEGMAAPAGWATGSVCVGQGETVHLNVFPIWYTPPAGIDVVKAVVWWYDETHDQSVAAEDGVHDKIWLRLQTQTSVKAPWVAAVVSETNDNRQRVFLEVAQQTRFRLEVVGASVESRTTNAADAGTCGNSKRRVFYAWMYESNQRSQPQPGLDGVRAEN